MAAQATPTRETTFDYDRTVVAFHGTRTDTARKLVAGQPFGASQNDDDWLGHGVYFWEYAPQQAWWWAKRRYGDDASVVGALVRLGRCVDLLDPSNVELLRDAHRELTTLGTALPNNANTHKFLDCIVFNYLYAKMAREGLVVQSGRGAASSTVATFSCACETPTTSSRYGPCGGMVAMASKKKAERTSRKRRIRPGPQAPDGLWSPAQMRAALLRGSKRSKIALLKEIGILDENGEVAAKYKSWGNKVTRTPELE